MGGGWKGGERERERGREGEREREGGREGESEGEGGREGERQGRRHRNCLRHSFRRTVTKMYAAIVAKMIAL